MAKAPNPFAGDADYLGPISATPQKMVETMLELAGVGPGDVVYDLGCNDGRVCITAARDPGGGGQGQTSGARRAGCELRSQLTTSISPSPSDWSTWTSLATLRARRREGAKPPRRGA